MNIIKGNVTETIKGSYIVSVVIIGDGTITTNPIMYYQIRDESVVFSHNPSNSLIGSLDIKYLIFYIKKK